jgi:hypothetical protein
MENSRLFENFGENHNHIIKDIEEEITTFSVFWIHILYNNEIWKMSFAVYNFTKT